MEGEKFLIFIMIIVEWNLMLNCKSIHGEGIKRLTPNKCFKDCQVSTYTSKSR